MMDHSFTRREFLKSTGILVGSLCLSRLQVREGYAAPTPYLYRSWEDLYRQKWSWDRVARGTHYVNCWYQSSCAFDLYVKDGIVVREEQAAQYPQPDPRVPDFNPRGCQKGSCYSQRMYSSSRVKYPLKRVGKRGEGKWKRLTWEEALSEIADRLIDVLRKEGPDTVLWDTGTNLSMGNQGLGFLRLAVLLDSSILDVNPEIGDDRQGAAVTLGKIAGGNSVDDWFHADLFFIWGANPIYTQIPNSHFFLEARYNGTRVIAISPDYSPSAIHADLWVPIQVGTDAALALSLAQVIVSERLTKESFLREQTDLPLLVREDTKRFLREADVKIGGRQDVFYFYDLSGKTVREAPRRTLNLGGQHPALEGSYQAETLQGKVRVRPVFELLKAKVAEYTPERVAAITGVHAEVIRRLAREIAQARAVTFIPSLNFSKFYHGVLTERAQLLVLALCGHFGRRGCSYGNLPFLPADAWELMAFLRRPGREGLEELQKEWSPLMEKLDQEGYTEEMKIFELDRQASARGLWASATLFWYIHGGLRELNRDARQWDPHLKRSPEAYLEESLKKGWQYIFPVPPKEPRVLFEYGGNFLRRVRGYPMLIKTLLPKLKLLVTVDWRMSSTALWSDYVLPAAGWYEKLDVRYATLYFPYIHLTAPAVRPLHESKPEWEIFCRLAKAIEGRAKERGISTFVDRQGKERKVDQLYQEMTMGGHYREESHEELARDLVSLSTNLEGVKWEELKAKGFSRLTGVGVSPVSIGSACDIPPDRSAVSFSWHTEKKQPWPTLTRRMQFYLDQELYLELGEALPTYKEPPQVGGKYPLVMTGGHARWSIHSAWRDEAWMLRLQRGVPVIYLNTADARRRGVADGDEVEVRNDIDSFRIQAKVLPSVRPGQVIVYHAWENYQFKDGKLFQNLMPSPLNPIELAGDYYHFRPMFTCFSPGQSDRDTRVEVVKVS